MAFCALPTWLEGHFYIGKTLLEVGFRHISPLFCLLQLQLLGGAARASEQFRFSILRNGGGLFVGFEVLGFSSTFFLWEKSPHFVKNLP